jgi:aminopeptidase N
MQWWRQAAESSSPSSTPAKSKRRPFALPDTRKRYAPDLELTVLHVKLELAVNPRKKTLAGVVHTTFRSLLATLHTVSFEAQDMEISAVTLSGSASELAFEHEEGVLLVTLPEALAPGCECTLSVTYRSVNPKLGVYFTGPDKHYAAKPYQVWTQSQDDDAHHWFPVLGCDHPNHKMTSEVIATVPQGFTALSNGSLVAESTGADGFQTFHWLHDQPHVTYLMALVVGEFERLEDRLGNLPVQAFVHADLKERAIEYFKGTAELVKLYGDLYGVPYPWAGKYAQVFVQDFIFGGMENTTITVMTDRILASAGTREEQRLQEVRLNAHELNHHWNGNLVTCRDWPHAWLNEGGACYGEVEAVEHLLGLKARDYYAYGLSKVYFAEDKRYRRPIVCQTYREPIELFDRHLYQKGALVRHMIRYLLGDKGYYASIQQYYRDNLYQSVETLDLIKAIEKATGKNLRQFFDQWVFAAGFPEYKVTYRYDRKAKAAVVKVAQTQTLDENTGLFSMPIPISFGFADGHFQDMTILVEEKETSFVFPMAEAPVMFRFDPHNLVLKTVELDLPRSMLVAQLEGDPAVMGRVFAAQALAKYGDDKAVQVLARASNFDENSFFWGVSAEAATSLGGMKSKASFQALKHLLSVSEPRVRRAVVNALGNFKTAEAGRLFAALIDSGEEKSEFVLADACANLGRTGWAGGLPTLTRALEIDSWNEIIRIGALNGLAELKEPKVVSLAYDFAKPGKPMAARPAALSCLGKLAKAPSEKSGKQHQVKVSEEALGFLHSLSKNQELAQFTLRMALVQALGEAKQASSIEVLESLRENSHDGRVKRLVEETINAIKNSQKASEKTAKAGI